MRSSPAPTTCARCRPMSMRTTPATARSTTSIPTTAAGTGRPPNFPIPRWPVRTISTARPRRDCYGPIRSTRALNGSPPCRMPPTRSSKRGQRPSTPRRTSCSCSSSPPWTAWSLPRPTSTPRWRSGTGGSRTAAAAPPPGSPSTSATPGRARAIRTASSPGTSVSTPRPPWRSTPSTRSAATTRPAPTSPRCSTRTASSCCPTATSTSACAARDTIPTTSTRTTTGTRWASAA